MVIRWWLIMEKYYKEDDKLTSSTNKENKIVIDRITKDSLLSLYGSMPPKGNSEQKEWSAIRQQAREEKLANQTFD